MAKILVRLVLENKEKNKQNSVSFENLKKLSSIISGTEMGTLVANISKSKKGFGYFLQELKGI